MRKAKIKRVIMIITMVVIPLVSFPILRVLKGKWNNPFNIQSQQVTRGDIEYTISTTGSIITSSHVRLGSKVNGQVVYLEVKEGDKVKKGDLIAQLDEFEVLAQVKQARANLLSAQANLEKVKAGARKEAIAAAEAELERTLADSDRKAKELARMQNLFKQEFVTQQQLDDAKVQYQIASAQAKSAQKNLELLRTQTTAMDIKAAEAQVLQAEANLNYMEAQLKNHKIAAPVSGYITQKYVEAGEMVGLSIPIVTISDMDSLGIECDVDETDIGEIKVGQKAIITLDAYPDRELTGVVEKIALQSEEQREKGITYLVKIKIEPTDLSLRLEMTADVKIIVAKKSNILTVDVWAVLEKDSKKYLWILKDSHAEYRKVETGLSNNDYIEIKDGVGEGEIILTGETDKIKDGQRIVLKKEKVR